MDDYALPLSTQSLTLTANHALVFDAAGANQSLLTAALVAVTMTAGAYALTLPPVTGIEKGAVSVWVLNTGGSTKTLEVKNSAGTHLCYLAPGEAAMFTLSSGGTVLMCRTSLLGAFSSGATPSLNRQVSIEVALLANATGATVNTDIAAFLPSDFVVEDAHVISHGATGGTVRLQTEAGAANITDAMVPGNASVITRAASLTFGGRTIAATAGFRVAVATGAPASTLVIRGFLAN
jgi:hypothetical protein